MVVSILQSNYIPWKGYFDIIDKSDCFVIYDEVQYTKNDWRNRNKIKTNQGVKWLTIPVSVKSSSQRISETEVANQIWRKKHWSTIKENYGRQVGFEMFGSVFEEFYLKGSESFLSEINRSLISLISNILKFDTNILDSTMFPSSGCKTSRLVQICKQLNATTYLSGPSARNYIDIKMFQEENIDIEWMDYSFYSQYPQIYPPFEHNVSILDLLFCVNNDYKFFLL